MAYRSRDAGRRRSAGSDPGWRHSFVGHYSGSTGATHAATLLAAAVSAAVTVIVVVVPHVQPSYRSLDAHVALETAASVIALLAGFLAAGRVWRYARLNDLALACGLAVTGVTDLVFVTVPALVGGSGRVTGWATIAGRVVGSALFAFAAFAPRRRLRRPGRLIAVSVAGAAGVLLVAAGVIGGLDGYMSGGLSLPRQGAPPVGPDPGASPAVAVLELSIALLYAIAATGFLITSRQRDDEFVGWLAVAVVLAAFSYVNYSLFPSLFAPWVSVGDAFRVAFYLLLLIASMREIRSYWHALSDASVLAERQRIARDLHDGLAQELAYLWRHLDALDGTVDDDTLERLRGAALRAQIESRRAVRMLAAPTGRPFDAALTEAVQDVADRLGIDVELDLTGGVRLSPARAETLTRVACEAVANAARHSGADVVRISLERDGPRVRLRVSDSGRGFDTTVPARGFGLVSMRERARSTGGELRIVSAPGEGSEVVITV